VKSNSASESAISIYVLEQNQLLRKALVQLLRKRTSFTVVGDCNDGAGALEELMVTPCEILLLSSLETLRVIWQRPEACEWLKQIKVVLFGMEENPEFFLQAVQMRASGYLLKEASSVDVIAALRSVAQGEVSCPPKLCKSLFDHFSKAFSVIPKNVGASGCVASDLTCRQRQLMALVAKGMTNKEIATNLHLSEFTIKNHIHRVMKFLEVDSRYAAVDVIRTSGLFLDA
jgi:DNA-binding NarL/FixJ family response regulator